MPKRIQSDVCSVAECDRPRATKTNGTRRSMCFAHYKRVDKYGDVLADTPVKERRPPGEGHLSTYGYWIVTRAGHPLAFAHGGVLEHRAVLYDAIGPGAHSCHWCRCTVDWGVSFPGALVVDHLDADRLNNDLANLVASCQPCNSSRAACGNPIDWSPSRTA